MKLYSISDIHVGVPKNRAFFETVTEHPEDWLILAGDVCETEADLVATLRLTTRRFAQVLWVPGNHELWTMRDAPERGEAKYLRFVSLCRDHGVLTPEDEYVTWKGEGPECRLAPLHLLYDYSFRPAHVPADKCLHWAAETGILCMDEDVLFSDPYPSKKDWCHALCDKAEARLNALGPGARTVLINHYPLREDLAVLPAIPRFSLWCGTKRTEDWHVRFAAEVVVSGHLHIRSTNFRDGVRFEETSLGYPKQWDPDRTMDSYLREILPGPPARELGG